MNCCLFCTIFICVFAVDYAKPPEANRISYETLYKAGIDAYLQNRWHDCISFFEKSLEDYFYFRTASIQCRNFCAQNYTDIVLDKNNDIKSDLQFQFTATGKALCLMKCQRSLISGRTKITEETDYDFQKKVPYNYLQLCYFKVGEPEKAASCAYTFLLHNAGHEVMKGNLKYYMAMPDINVDKIKYLESKDYQELFLKGAQLYTEKKYDDAIPVMEKSLQEYLVAEEECRLLCEGPMPETTKEELYVSIANHFTFALRCKLNCPETLSYMYSQKHEHLFSSHYNYLQFSYYKTGKLKETCEAVASFLKLQPNDKIMRSNRNFYLKLEEVSEDWFIPRKDALEYFKRRETEQNLLKIVEESFKFETLNQGVITSPTPPPGSPALQKPQMKQKLGKKRKDVSSDVSAKWLQDMNISTLLNEVELNGTKRVAFSGLATEKECQKLVDLATEGAIYGDGYNGKESPHTEFEMFEGLTIARAATLAQRGILNAEAAQLFLDISEKARQAVEMFFNLETELFFAYTHLVCRTALPESSDSRKDLSHPVHADNCVLMPNGECLKEKPAYIWRDYSSIVYINEDFEGGEFIFAEDKTTVQATVAPKCGLMVAFSAGKENLHGVKAVRKGRRCALAMWYTLDAAHKEKERAFANKVLSDLVEKRKFLEQGEEAMKFEKATLLKLVDEISTNKDSEGVHSHSEL